MNVNGYELLIDLTEPGTERMYLTHEVKGHDITVAARRWG